MMLTAIILFLFVSLILYVLLGGADYGAGIVELFRGSRANTSKIVSHAMGPVWEANHIWLVLVVVIFFVGFPRAYALVCISLHLPLLFALTGIVLRGTAFTFRTYDAIQDETDRWYSRIFVLSSLITPFWLGVIAASLYAGKIDPGADSYVDLYILPWLGAFQFSVGLFTISLFGYLASVYLLGESKNPAATRFFRSRAQAFAFTSFGMGVLVFAAAGWDQIEIAWAFFRSPLSLLCMVLGTVSIFPLWKFLQSGRVNAARFVVAFQVGSILVGWFAAEFPRLLRTRSGDYSFQALAAPESTLSPLLFALVAGLLLVVPAFLYLLALFKKNSDE